MNKLRPAAMIAALGIGLGGALVMAFPAVADETPVEETVVVQEVPEAPALSVSEEEPTELAAAPRVADSVVLVTICHQPDSPAEQTKEVPEQAVEGHLGHGDYLGECTPQEEEPDPETDATPYILCAWTLPNDLPDGPIWPGQKIKKCIDVATGDLSALDSQLVLCGVDFQIDLYLDNEVTASLIAGGVLNGPGNPPEALAYGAEGLTGNPWKYLDNEDCPPPTNRVCETFTDLGVSTDLVANGWSNFESKPGGSASYVPGGLALDNADGNSKVSWIRAIAIDSLADIGQTSISYTHTSGNLPSGPGFNVFVDSDGNGSFESRLVGEPNVYGQDWWATPSSLFPLGAPQTGGGFGSDRHGTIDEWLALYGDIPVSGYVALAYGTGGPSSGVLHGGTFGCATFGFNRVPLIEQPEPRIDRTEWIVDDVECDVTETTRSRTAVTTTWTIEVVDGGYVLVPHVGDPVVEIEPVAVEDVEECPEETPPPSSPPTDSLAYTGGSVDAAPWAIGALVVIVISVLALTVVRLGRHGGDNA